MTSARPVLGAHACLPPLLILSWLWAVPAVAQDTVLVSDEPACPTCSVGFVREVTIGGDDDPFGIVRRDAEQVAFMPNGDLWLASTQVRGRLLRYSRAGELLQELDYEGDGPGEFRGSYAVIQARDSLFVFAGTRLVAYDGNGEPARSENLPMNIFQLAQIGDSAVLVNALMAKDGATEPTGMEAMTERIVTVGLDGTIGQEFTGPFTGLTQRDRMRTKLAASGADSFWTVPRNRYELTRWDAQSGEPTRVIVRESQWFEPWEYEEWSEPRYDAAPTSISYIHLDRDGLLWVVTFIADENPSRRNPRDPYFADHPRLDAMVEALDPDEGVVVARGRFPGVTSRFLTDGRIAFFDATPSFAQLIHFGRFEVVGGSPGGGP